MENDETFALIGIIALPVSIFALILFFTITDYNFNEIQFSINDTNVSINESWIISVLNNSDITIDVNVNNTEHLQGRDTSTLYTYFKGFFDSVYYPFSNPYSFYNSTTLPPQTDYDNSTIARIGSCPEGQVVQNTTNLGVQCVEVSGGDVNLTGYALLNGSNQPFTAPISVSYATGDGVTPVKMILNSTTDGTWTIGSIFAEYDMHSSDTSGGGAGVRTAIKGVVETALGQQNGIALWTTSSGLSAIAEHFRFSGTGNFRIGAGIPSSDFEINKNGGADIKLVRANSASYRSIFFFNTGSTTDWLFGTLNGYNDLSITRGLAGAPYTQTIMNFSKSTGNIYLPIVNQRLYFGDTYITSNNSEMFINSNAIHSTGNVTSDGYFIGVDFLTGSKVIGTKEDSLSKLDNIDSWLNKDGSINYSSHYAFVNYSENKTDYSKPVNVIKQIEICEVPIIEVPIIVEECSFKQDSKGLYNKICYNKTEMQNVSKTILNTTCDYFEVSKDKFQYICYESEIPSVECRNETYIETTYPYTKIEYSNKLSMETRVAEMENMINQLRKQNELLTQRVTDLEKNINFDTYGIDMKESIEPKPWWEFWK